MLRVLEKNPNDVPQPPNNPPQGIVSDGIQQQLQQQQLQQQQSNNNLNR
ncbi:MAG TPA: hypothetical protein VLA74_04015 [Nitrososphaeraceae archaeon]|nr:hypothetical protein [Nitrososphaeraceae archaeon]